MKPSAKLHRIYTRLLTAYGPQRWWPAETAFEVVIGAYLTQNTSWRAVEKSIANLAAAHCLTIDGLRAVPEDELRTLIRPSGYMIRKAAALKAFVAMLDRDHAGRLDLLAAQPAAPAREALLSLPGVGPETADAILLYALGHPVAVVDEYLRRVVTRHGMLPAKAKYLEIQSLALSTFAGEPIESHVRHHNEFHALIVEVGKRHCGPTPRCAGCPLAEKALTPPPDAIP